MLARLKATPVGKWLYRLSRRQRLGAPLRWLLDLGVAEQLDPAHWKAAHRQHNARQAATLAAFRSATRGAGQ